MARPVADKLFVNLSASQVRKRLKGFGLGVKRIEASGRNQAVIVHTATGDHLETLKTRFRDVTQSISQWDLDVPIENLRNLGATSARWLREIGVGNKSDLQRMGPVLAYRLVRQRQPRASVNLLWAMAAGLNEEDWRDLTNATKAKLRAEVDQR